jgi:hypothetical protein
VTRRNPPHLKKTWKPHCYLREWAELVAGAAANRSSAPIVRLSMRQLEVGAIDRADTTLSGVGTERGRSSFRRSHYFL